MAYYGNFLIFHLSKENMNTKLLMSLNEKDKEEFKKLYALNDTFLLRVIREALSKQLQESVKQMRSISSGDIDNWETMILERIVEQRTLESVLELIKPLTKGNS